MQRYEQEQARSRDHAAALLETGKPTRETHSRLTEEQIAQLRVWEEKRTRVIEEAAARRQVYDDVTYMYDDVTWAWRLIEEQARARLRRGGKLKVDDELRA